MSVRDFKLPDLGEGLTESELVGWRVAVGDPIELNQVIAEVETAKALVELPSPFAGVVARLYGEPGETIQVGAPLMSVEVESVEEAAEPARAERTPVLVGYGPTVGDGSAPKRKARGGVADGAGADSAVVSTRSTGSAGETPRSTPPVRKLAASLGVDLASVVGSGSDGLITRGDVERAASGATVSEPARPSTSSGTDRRTPISGVRKLTAEAMVASAFTAPHVTVFLDVDVTRSVRLVERLRETPEFSERRLNLLVIVARAVTLALGNHPSLNARWDAAAHEIVELGSITLGIAAATPRGLMVPNLKRTEQLRLPELADALAGLVATARAGRTSPADLTGGSFTISNVGVFGVDAGTPILNPGEAGILALGAVRKRPWEHRGKVKLRDVMTLSLSFDHRVVDGEQGSRFLAEVGAILEEPGTALARI
ncbi:2-oxo acid dehydrogenase subunit E2 [Glaciihabitans arcticus]|uniref:Dihydrolipoamide acetyltransferase component of pyruvate dehydrogenase complex n=1 Tax=Glaciihabitans arcticus TaxID=2668039 RepID=A0A4Q9GQH0_9MICO|nr:dihydrolipoamide acetyltransferase family protein [Glaciihabitans arcticus]TBN57122.1 2-oxo acid dehydrogenase subunit E2 [Glaciihabitans arcticus]